MDFVINPLNETLILSFQSSDTMQKNLWSSLFDEAIARYPAEVAAFNKTYPEKTVPDVIFTKDNNVGTKLEIIVTGTNWVKVYIREATYDVSLVNRYANAS